MEPRLLTAIWRSFQRVPPPHQSPSIRRPSSCIPRPSTLRPRLSCNPASSGRRKSTGNDTPTPNGTLNLLATAGGDAAGETGLFLNTNGTIHFAPGQTFPGTGKITSVGLSAPSSDFKVTGSPVTGAGTLGLNWTVAPTNADTANAIVKRDANGGFSAGAITANLGMEGVSTGGNGVFGQGNVGVWGQSTGTNGGSDGVHGVTSSGGASGVAGVNNAGGVGVYGTGGTGVFGTGSNYGFVTDSNVQQARTAGGWIKAMVEVDPAMSPIIPLFQLHSHRSRRNHTAMRDRAWQRS